MTITTKLLKIQAAERKVTKKMLPTINSKELALSELKEAALICHVSSFSYVLLHPWAMLHL
jgi:hypothetical protein